MGNIVREKNVFESSSAPGTFYETITYTDGSMSCNCPGWTRRVQKDGSRCCKHIERVKRGETDGITVLMGGRNEVPGVTRPMSNAEFQDRLNKTRDGEIPSAWELRQRRRQREAEERAKERLQRQGEKPKPQKPQPEQPAKPTSGRRFALE